MWHLQQKSFYIFLKAIHGMDGIPGVVNCFHVLTPFLPASSFDSAPPHLSIYRRSLSSPTSSNSFVVI